MKTERYKAGKAGKQGRLGNIKGRVEQEKAGNNYGWELLGENLKYAKFFTIFSLFPAFPCSCS